MSISPKLHDVVRLTTGEEGTIVDVSRRSDKIAFAIELDALDPDVALVYAQPDQIAQVIWVSP